MSMLHPEHIPADLTQRPQWVTWKYVKGQKVPFNPTTGKAASSTDPATWGTFDTAQQAAAHRHHAGVGYVFTEDDGVVGIDLDDCLTDGDLHPWARQIVATMQTYTEVSPSGTGVKLWVKGAIPKNRKATPGAAHQIELYTTARFFTVTGNRLAGTPATIRTVTAELSRLYDSLRPAPVACVSRLPHAPTDTEQARRYAVGALEQAHQAMLAAGEGERHSIRLKEAYALAGLMPHITEDEITAALAVNFGSSADNAMATIRDGMRAGQAAPRTIPAPQYPNHQIDGRPPVELDELDTLDAETLRQRLRATIAERDHFRQRAEKLERWRAWAVTVVALPTERLSPAAKVTALSIYPEMMVRQEQGITEPAPILIEQDCKRAGLSASSHSKKLQELNTVAHMAYTKTRDPKTGHSRVLMAPGAFFEPATWAPPAPRNHGGARVKYCQDCGSENLVAQTRIVCADCGAQAGETQHRHINPAWPAEEQLTPDHQFDSRAVQAMIAQADAGRADPNPQLARPERLPSSLGQQVARRPATDPPQQPDPPMVRASGRVDQWDADWVALQRLSAEREEHAGNSTKAAWYRTLIADVPQVESTA